MVRSHAENPIERPESHIDVAVLQHAEHAVEQSEEENDHLGTAQSDQRHVANEVEQANRGGLQ
jgi:hypothetical protein